MRGGSESFLLKDLAFYRSKMTAALGVDTERIYEEIRTHVWRSRVQGSRKLRDAAKSGDLSASLCRTTIAHSLGLSVRTVQRRINYLRSIGWIRAENGHGSGEALVFQLGYVLPGGLEVFYADVDCREFCNHLTDLAEQQETTVSKLPVLDRARLAREWLNRSDRSVLIPSIYTTAPGVVPQRHYPSATVALVEGGVVPQGHLIIDNPSGSGIDKSEEYTGGEPPEHISGPQPKLMADPSDANVSGRPSSKNKRQYGNDTKNKNELGETNTDEVEEGITTSALDNALDSGQDGDERFARAQEAGKVGAQKADVQNDKNNKRRERRAQVQECQERLIAGRTGQMEASDANAQRRENLKGGTQYSYEVIQGGREVWKVYAELLKERDSRLPVVRWNASGNAKARGQVYRLVDMYGTDATIGAVQYTLENWDSINQKYFKRTGNVPNFGLISHMHESLFREAALWGEHRGVVEEWKSWMRDHENDDERPPSELRARYKKAKAALEAFGLGS